MVPGSSVIMIGGLEYTRIEVSNDIVWITSGARVVCTTATKLVEEKHAYYFIDKHSFPQLRSSQVDETVKQVKRGKPAPWYRQFEKKKHAYSRR